MKIHWKWKTCYKSGNESFFRMDVFPEDTMVKDMHKMQEKGGIKPCNVSFNMVDSLIMEKMLISYCWGIHQQR